MSFTTHVIFNLTAGVAALIGWIRIKKTDPAFLPFTILLTAGFITELVSFYILKKGYSNALVYNFFILAEALLVTWLYKSLGLFKKKNTSVLLRVFYVVLWLTEFFLRLRGNEFMSYFIIVYSSVLVIQAIDLLPTVLLQTAHKLYMNSVFLIAMGFVIYFTYTIITELFWFYGLNQSSIFRTRIYELFTYINLFTNILFILAALWIPLKREYILRSL
jgi:hypothetical protein